MGFLNILGYIGVGLAAALVLLGISYAMSRPKETVLYEGNVIKQRGEGNWTVASLLSGILMCVLATLLFNNLAHFSVLKSIGLGLLVSIVAYILITIILTFILAVIIRNADKILDKTFFPLTLILCLLNGAAFAVLVSVWGWF